MTIWTYVVKPCQNLDKEKPMNLSNCAQCTDKRIIIKYLPFCFKYVKIRPNHNELMWPRSTKEFRFFSLQH